MLYPSSKASVVTGACNGVGSRGPPEGPLGPKGKVNGEGPGGSAQGSSGLSTTFTCLRSRLRHHYCVEIGEEYSSCQPFVRSWFWFKSPNFLVRGKITNTVEILVIL